jgi:putative PIN family toxin of toxin-antitoxin system
MRAVLDTNVLISALAFPGSKPDQILDRVRRHELQLIVSPFILEETRRILVRKLGLGQATAAALIRTLSNLAEMVHPAKRLHLVTAKDDDNRVLECAIAGEADFLVTGDRTHLLPLQSVGRARIVSPADFLSILEPPRKAT